MVPINSWLQGKKELVYSFQFDLHTDIISVIIAIHRVVGKLFGSFFCIDIGLLIMKVS